MRDPLVRIVNVTFMADVEVGTIGEIFRKKGFGQPLAPKVAHQPAGVVKQRADRRGDDEYAQANPQTVFKGAYVFFRECRHQVAHRVADGDAKGGRSQKKERERNKQEPCSLFVL